MPTVLGVDGCPHGWCAVRLDTSTETLASSHHDSFRDVLRAFPQDIIAIDVPIGLMEGPGGRDCDSETRAILGRPRGSSVFSPPARQTLEHCGIKGRYKKACAVNRKATGVAISQQAFWIGPKIREVDDAMTPALEKRVYEVHPEVSLATLAKRPMEFRKSKPEGRKERWRHLRKAFRHLPARPLLPPDLRGLCDIEDYVDAVVCAWTAARIVSREAVSLPEKPPRDARRLRMAIWR